MTLDIIIPRYKEPWDLCKYLFDSIAMQRGVSFNNVHVIVVNDGDEDVLDEGVFADYPYTVEYKVKPHGGVSDTRNAGLMESKADYVMFCDIDDGFLNNYGIHSIFSAMQEGFDMLCCNFIEETFDANGNMTIIPHRNDLTFMHGKVYRRQFLLDNELRFDPAMTIHEDGYFNMLVYAVASHGGKYKTVDTPVYLWRWNNNSTVRRDRKDFVLKTYEDVMLTRTGLCNELDRRGYKEDFETAVCMTVLNSYYDFQKTSFYTRENAKYLAKAEKAFKGFWKRFGRVMNNCTNQKIAEVARVARENAYKNGMLFEQTDLRSFIKHIEREVKG